MSIGKAFNMPAVVRPCLEAFANDEAGVGTWLPGNFAARPAFSQGYVHEYSPRGHFVPGVTRLTRNNNLDFMHEYVLIVGSDATAARPIVRFPQNAAFHSYWWGDWCPVIDSGATPQCHLADAGTASKLNVARAVAMGRIQRLARIQAAFGFPLNILARILRRSRTQIYKWLDADEQLDLQGDSVQRLAKIEHIAEMWRVECDVTLYSVAREPLPSGVSIIDLLSKANLDEVAIAAGFGSLAKIAQAAPLSASQRLLEKGFERRKRSLPDDD